MLEAIRSALGSGEAATEQPVSRGKPVLRVVGSDAEAAEEAATPDAPVSARRPAVHAHDGMTEWPRGRKADPQGRKGAAKKTIAPKAPRKPSRLGLWLRSEAARWTPLLPFTIATLAPVPLLLLAAAFGGGWVALALLWMTGLTFAIGEGRLRRRALPIAPEPPTLTPQ